MRRLLVHDASAERAEALGRHRLRVEVSEIVVGPHKRDAQLQLLYLITYKKVSPLHVFRAAMVLGVVRQVRSSLIVRRAVRRGGHVLPQA